MKWPGGLACGKRCVRMETIIRNVSNQLMDKIRDIDIAADTLLKDGRLAEYANTPTRMAIVEKYPQQFEATLQVIDKRLKLAKKKSVILHKDYEWPEYAESAVAFDVVFTLRKFILDNPEPKNIQAWNDTFGKSFPHYAIEKPTTEADDPAGEHKTSQQASSEGGR